MIVATEDPIEKLKLSTRASNALRRSGINTIKELLSYPKDDFINIKNLGAKTLLEINTLLNKINEKEIIIINDVEDLYEPEIKNFIHIDGNRYKDKPINELGLSVRPINCLKKAGYNWLSELILKNQDEFFNIPNMGKKSVFEIIEKVKKIELVPFKENTYNDNISPELLCNAVFTSLSEKINLNGVEHYEAMIDLFSKYLEENDKINDISLCLSDENLKYKIQKTLYVKYQFQKYLIEVITRNQYGCTLDYIYNETPALLKQMDFIKENIKQLMDYAYIRKFDNKHYIINYPSFVDGAKPLLSEREYNIFIKRTQNLTLEEIGKSSDVTRERIRQIEAKAIQKLNKTASFFLEDIFLDIYKKYNITAEEFAIAFENLQTYYYLVLRYSSPKKKNKDRKQPLKNALEDSTIPEKIRRLIEKAVYKDYVKIGKEYIPCTRSEITNYILRTYATEDLSFDDFTEVYFAVLEDIGKENVEKLSIMDRGYLNKLSSSNNVLWKFGKKFRYYNIKNYDFTDFFETLNLNQYRDVEYSTLKFFNLYPELMKDYDIHDEYELHNLLKKICDKKSFPHLTFKRMPTIEFGTADRDKQVLELLLTLAPISNDDFSKEYEQEFGVSANTVLANYMKNFDQYFYNGIYKIDAPALPSIMADRLKLLLTEDFYLISTIRHIYKNEFPNANLALLNPYSLKSLGFKVYSNYAINDKYRHAAEYFNYILTKDDITDISIFQSDIKQVITYTSQLYKLKADYEIVEFSPNMYISFSRLKENGITKDLLNDFVIKALNFAGKNIYFTMFSLRKDGFTHKLDILGFDDWFYTSLLIEHKDYVSYQRIGGNKVLLYGKTNVLLEGFIEFIVFNQETLSIDVYKLAEMLKSYYNVNITALKLKETVRNSSMFYDTISEKVYADYDTYYNKSISL